MTRTQLPSGPRDPGRHPGGTTALSTVTRLLLTAGLFGLTASGLGAGVLAGYTGDGGTAAAASAGAVALAPVSVDGPGNRLSVAATDLGPGDTAERAVTLRADGTVAIDPASVVLSVSALSVAPGVSAPPFLADPVDGLQVRIDRCSGPWAESGVAPAFTYACAGTVTEVLARRPVLGDGVRLVGLSGDPGAAHHLRVTLELPAGAPAGTQAQSGELLWSFTASQRAAADR